MIDWGKAEQEAGGNYKPYANSGVHKVKVAGIEIHRIATGSVAQDFTFVETEVQYPKATHWLSFKNDNWRFIHNRSLMMLLGASKEDAQKAVEACESKGSEDNKISAYQQMYERLIKKQPEVEIEVWQEGKYGRSDFTDNSVRMSRPDDERKESPLKGAEEVSSSEFGELPF